ncbi:hypothetical protein [Paludisphaera sp.]|uniref:hypothetical protein n=1 Tax=Paludisphaera sp. TaxID=2017432 RepID=UPI00301BC806
MTRRLATTLLALIPLVAAPSPARAEPPEAVDVGQRRELFVDRHLIDTLSGAELRMHRPVDRGPVLSFDRPWEGTFAAYVTIIHADGKYRAYYRGMGAGGVRKDSDPVQVICLAESDDGVRWTKPALDLFPRAGEPTTNIVLADAAAVTHNFAPFLDSRPGVDPAERYKAIGGVHEQGLSAYASPDGVHWKRMRDAPVLTREDVQVDAGGDAYVFDSQNVAFWSDAERKYLLYYRVFRDDRRRIARVESDDFLAWRNPTLMEYRRGDGEPAPVEHLYTNQTHPYFRAPHVYIATAARFMPGRRAITAEQAKAIGVDPGYFNDVSDAILMSTRGGNVYDRSFMEAFVAPGVGPGNWTSRTNYPALNVVQTGPDEMSLYVNQEYGQPTAHLRRYGMRLDGFASVHADYDGGEMTTKPLTFRGSRLLLNFATSAAGGIRVEIQRPDGTPIPGFALADCAELIGNEIERPVAFAGGLDSLAGQPVRLRFVMKDADLFALRFAD